MARLLLSKKDALEPFGGVGRQAALALGISAQAVSSWGRYVPELMAYKLIDIKPALRSKARYAQPRRRRLS